MASMLDGLHCFHRSRVGTMSAEGSATWVPCQAGQSSLALPPLGLRPVSAPPSQARRFIGQAGLALLGAGLIFAFATTVVHARQEVFYVPAYGVGIAAGALCVAVIGLGLSWRSHRFGLALLTMLAVSLGVMGVLAILSIGIVLLAISVMLGLVVATQLTGDGGGTAGAAGGALLGLAVPVLAVVAMSGPLVECELGGARAGESLFLGFESGSSGGEGAMSPDGRTSSGRTHGDTYEYMYRCQDGKLVYFDFRHR